MEQKYIYYIAGAIGLAIVAILVWAFWPKAGDKKPDDVPAGDDGILATLLQSQALEGAEDDTEELFTNEFFTDTPGPQTTYSPVMEIMTPFVELKPEGGVWSIPGAFPRMMHKLSRYAYACDDPKSFDVIIGNEAKTKFLAFKGYVDIKLQPLIVWEGSPRNPESLLPEDLADKFESEGVDEDPTPDIIAKSRHGVQRFTLRNFAILIPLRRKFKSKEGSFTRLAAPADPTTRNQMFFQIPFIVPGRKDRRRPINMDKPIADQLGQNLLGFQEAMSLSYAVFHTKKRQVIAYDPYEGMDVRDTRYRGDETIPSNSEGCIKMDKAVNNTLKKRSKRAFPLDYWPIIEAVLFMKDHPFSTTAAPE
jgi:hypothetical protein